MTPSSRARKRKHKTEELEERSMLTDMRMSLQNINTKLVNINTAEDSKSIQSSDKFAEYIATKMQRIDVEEIRDEAEMEILNVIQSALQKCKSKQNN